MNGSPAKLGTIQGTSGHASALKQASDERTAKEIKEAVELQELKEKERINQDIIEKNAAEREKNIKKQNKKKAKDELKKHKGTEGSKKDGLYDTESDAFKNLSESAQKRARDLNDKKLKKRTKKEKEENKRLANRSEKTKRLEEEVKKADKKTEEKRLKSEAKKDKGWLSGKKRAARKYKRAGAKEDKARERLAESEVFDTLTPDEKIAKRRQKMAYLEAMFNQDARTMANIAGIKTDKAKIDQNTEGDEKMNIKKPNSFVKNYNTEKKFDYKIDVDNIGADDGVKQKEGEV